MQGRLEEVAAVLVEFYEGADHGAKPALNERLGDMRSRANAWRDALWWLGATADLGATPATYAVKRALRALSNANAKSRLFDFAVFSAEFRAKLCDRLLDALLDRRHDLLCDDLAAVLHALAAADLDGFFGSFVPAKLQNAPGLDDAQRRAVLAGWGRAPDAPSFVANLNDAVNDVAFYRLQNLHAME